MAVSRRRSRRLWLSFLLSGWALWAEAAGGQPSELHGQYLVDGAATLTAESVLAWEGAGHWQRFATSKANFGFSRAAYWFRLHLPATLPTAPLLVLDNPHLDWIELYQLQAGGKPMLLYRAGDRLPYAERLRPGRAFAFPLQDLGESRELVLRVQTAGLAWIPIRLESAEQFDGEQRAAPVRWGAGAGALILLAVLHGVAGLVMRCRLHAGLAGLICMLLLFQLYLAGYAYPLLWPNAPDWENRIAPALIALAAATLSLYAIDLLRLAGRADRWLSIWQWLWAMLCAGAIAAGLMLPAWLGLRLEVLFGLAAFAVAAAAGVMLWRSGDSRLRLIASAWLLVCLVVFPGTDLPGTMGQALSTLHPLPGVVALVLLSLAIGLREHGLQSRLLARQADAIRRLRQLRDLRQHRTAEEAVLRRKLLEQERELDRLRAALRQSAEGDVGPAVATRQVFDREYRQAWQQAYRERAMLSLIMVEVDGFAGLATEYGDPFGERAVQQVAAALQERFRRPMDRVARFAPAVLAVIAPDTAQEDAFRLVDDARRQVEATGLDVRGLRRPLTISAGIASLVPDQRHYEAVLLSFADDALHQARAAGGNRGVCYRLPLPAERES